MATSATLSSLLNLPKIVPLDLKGMINVYLAKSLPVITHVWLGKQYMSQSGPDAVC